jgi:hypothetical protein
MAAAKKKFKVQASEVGVENRSLEAVLLELAEQVKVNDARCARAEERSARAEKRSARARAEAAAALKTIAAVTQDLRAITQELRDFNARADGRLRALEKLAGV